MPLVLHSLEGQLTDRHLSEMRKASQRPTAGSSKSIDGKNAFSGGAYHLLPTRLFRGQFVPRKMAPQSVSKHRPARSCIAAARPKISDEGRPCFIEHCIERAPTGVVARPGASRGEENCLHGVTPPSMSR